MPSLVRRAALAVGALALLAPLGAARAQGGGSPSPSPSLFQVAPYAGYMLFGDIFDGPLGTTLANANGPVYGAQLSVRLLPGVSLVGNLARADADLQVGLPFLGGYDIGRSSVILYDAGVEVGTSLGDRARIPLAPFVQVGIGGMRHDVSSAGLRTDATNVAYNAGVGADLALSRGIGIRLLAKDYMGRFDTAEATGLGTEAKFAHNWALSGGITLAF